MEAEDNAFTSEDFSKLAKRMGVAIDEDKEKFDYTIKCIEGTPSVGTKDEKVDEKEFELFMKTIPMAKEIKEKLGYSSL